MELLSEFEVARLERRFEEMLDHYEISNPMGRTVIAYWKENGIESRQSFIVTSVHYHGEGILTLFFPFTERGVIGAVLGLGHSGDWHLIRSRQGEEEDEERAIIQVALKII
jgi:hypothetical protein